MSKTIVYALLQRHPEPREALRLSRSRDRKIETISFKRIGDFPKFERSMVGQISWGRMSNWYLQSSKPRSNMDSSRAKRKRAHLVLMFVGASPCVVRIMVSENDALRILRLVRTELQKNFQYQVQNVEPLFALTSTKGPSVNQSRLVKTKTKNEKGNSVR